MSGHLVNHPAPAHLLQTKKKNMLKPNFFCVRKDVHLKHVRVFSVYGKSIFYKIKIFKKILGTDSFKNRALLEDELLCTSSKRALLGRIKVDHEIIASRT